ncbi:hypothetical protein [Nostoc sp. ChiSLP03a]|nr:hypothetical protein [Nostoc sp. ChiSLP03a]MDZ8213351.1 hypothetical protein [Nostoc sp. ChiSLP03a]
MTYINFKDPVVSDYTKVFAVAKLTQKSVLVTIDEAIALNNYGNTII